MPKNVFSVSMNCFTWGRFNVAQCLEQIKKTPIRMVELPAEQTRPGSLIPELMVNAPLGGEWQYSLPDLKELLAKDGFRVGGVAVFGYTGYPGSADFIKRRIDFAVSLGAGARGIAGAGGRPLVHLLDAPHPACGGVPRPIHLRGRDVPRGNGIG